MMRNLRIEDFESSFVMASKEKKGNRKKSHSRTVLWMWDKYKFKTKKLGRKWVGGFCYRELGVNTLRQMQDHLRAQKNNYGNAL